MVSQQSSALIYRVRELKELQNVEQWIISLLKFWFLIIKQIKLTFGAQEFFCMNYSTKDPLISKLLLGEASTKKRSSKTFTLMKRYPRRWRISLKDFCSIILKEDLLLMNCLVIQFSKEFKIRKIHKNIQKILLKPVTRWTTSFKMFNKLFKRCQTKMFSQRSKHKMPFQRHPINMSLPKNLLKMYLQSKISWKSPKVINSIFLKKKPLRKWYMKLSKISPKKSPIYHNKHPNPLSNH